MRRRLVAAVAAAVALASVAMVRGGGGGPPLYDGVCLPPTYLQLGSTPGPGTASATYTAAQLQQTLVLTTPENPTPQAQMIIAAGTLVPAGGASAVTVTITPVRPPAAPPDGTIAGNVYDVAAVSGGQAVAPLPGHPVTIALEAPGGGGPALTIEREDAGHWTALKTFQSGCGTTYEVATPTLGRFALVAVGASRSSPASPPQGGGAGISALVIVLGVIAVLGAVIAAARIGRRRLS
ncbi:MAG: hypothetical protein ACYDAC_11780 [Candidatus Dormibacteria bacterium]